MSLISSLKAPIQKQTDVFDQPAFQSFADAADQLAAWVEKAKSTLPSLRVKYEEAARSTSQARH